MTSPNPQAVILTTIGRKNLNDFGCIDIAEILRHSVPQDDGTI